MPYRPITPIRGQVVVAQDLLHDEQQYIRDEQAAEFMQERDARAGRRVNRRLAIGLLSVAGLAAAALLAASILRPPAVPAPAAMAPSASAVATAVAGQGFTCDGIATAAYAPAVSTAARAAFPQITVCNSVQANRDQVTLFARADGSLAGMRISATTAEWTDVTTLLAAALSPAVPRDTVLAVVAAVSADTAPATTFVSAGVAGGLSVAVSPQAGGAVAVYVGTAEFANARVDGP